MPSKIVPLAYFKQDTLVVAEGLIGMRLCRCMPDGRILKYTIYETEAYDGPDDKASHAHRGPTSRNKIMFGPPGRWYVYLCYGVHWLLNISTGPQDYPAAVLIRAAGTVSGPGRLTKSLSIDKQFNALKCQKNKGLWIEYSHQRVDLHTIHRTPRIGINYAGSPWIEAPYRFLYSPVQNSKEA